MNFIALAATIFETRANQTIHVTLTYYSFVYDYLFTLYTTQKHSSNR